MSYSQPTSLDLVGQPRTITRVTLGDPTPTFVLTEPHPNCNPSSSNSGVATTWTTREGMEIPIQLMTNGHLCNTLSYLLRRTCVKAREEALKGGLRFIVNADQQRTSWLPTHPFNRDEVVNSEDIPDMNLVETIEITAEMQVIGVVVDITSFVDDFEDYDCCSVFYDPIQFTKEKIKLFGDLLDEYEHRVSNNLIETPNRFEPTKREHDEAVPDSGPTSEEVRSEESTHSPVGCSTGEDRRSPHYVLRAARWISSSVWPRSATTS